MSEYINVDVEYDDDDPDVARLKTNLDLAPEGDESYPDREAGEEGSTLAQFLFEIEGLAALSIAGGTLTVHRNPDVEWYALVDEITSALKAFFL
jgi:hypothetical protein